MTETPAHAAEPDAHAGARRTALVVGGLSAALLIAAGGLLWGHLGGAVFSDYVLTGLAWCL